MDKNTLKDILRNPDNYYSISSILTTTIELAYILVPFLVLTNLTYNYANSWVRREQTRSFIDFGEIKRVIIVLFLIPAIPSILYFISYIGHLLHQNLFTNDNDTVQAMSNFVGLLEESDDKKNNSGFIPSLPSKKKILLWIYTAMAYISMLVLWIVKIVIIFLMSFLSKFLIIISPLATSFSILPFLKDKLESLLKLFLNISFVGLTLNILDTLFFNEFVQALTTVIENNSLSDMSISLIFTASSVVIIMFYVMSIWLTAQYVGDPAASGILTMSTAIGASAVSYGTKIIQSTSKSSVSGAKNLAREGANRIFKPFKKDSQ